MKSRLNAFVAAPQQIQAFVDFSTAMAKDGVEPSLAELVKIRASQLNHCAFCLHMHTREALAAGESELRLTMLAAWQESPLYTDRERAALAWTESLTLLPETGAPDAVYAELQAHFTPEGQKVPIDPGPGETEGSRRGGRRRRRHYSQVMHGITLRAM